MINEYQNIYNVDIINYIMLENKGVMKVRTSRKAYLFVYIMIFILMFTVITIETSERELSKFAFGAALVFSAVLISFIEIHRFATFYKITSSSLVRSQGIFSRKTRKIDLTSISDVDSKQTAWQRTLNYGDVHARLFSAETTLAVKNINDPEKFSDFLEEKMNEKRSEGGQGGTRG